MATHILKFSENILDNRAETMKSLNDLPVWK